MISITCPKCWNEFNDYCGENATANALGYMIDYNRYYRCPHCGTDIDLQTDTVVNYKDIKNLKGENEDESEEIK